MHSASPRVAYFPDTFYEINGVAHTSRHFEAFARRRNIPFFCLHPGKKDSAIQEQQQGELSTLARISTGHCARYRPERTGYSRRVAGEESQGSPGCFLAHESA